HRALPDKFQRSQASLNRVRSEDRGGAAKGPRGVDRGDADGGGIPPGWQPSRTLGTAGAEKPGEAGAPAHATASHCQSLEMVLDFRLVPFERRTAARNDSTR